MKKLIFPLIALLALYACSSYGDKVKINNSEVFYKDGGKEADARRLGEFLMRIQYFDASSHKSAQLMESGGKPLVKLVVDPDKFNAQKEELGLSFKYIQQYIQDSVFSGKPIVLELTDDKLKTFHNVTPLTDAEKAQMLGGGDAGTDAPNDGSAPGGNPGDDEQTPE